MELRILLDFMVMDPMALLVRVNGLGALIWIARFNCSRLSFEDSVCILCSAPLRV
jgi:hypothetical protein